MQYNNAEMSTNHTFSLYCRIHLHPQPSPEITCELLVASSHAFWLPPNLAPPMVKSLSLPLCKCVRVSLPPLSVYLFVCACVRVFVKPPVLGVRVVVSVLDTAYKVDLTFLVVRLNQF